MPYFARIFAPSDIVPPLEALRAPVAQYAATLATDGPDADWETAELRYDDEEAPVDIERYLPATDGLFEEDLNAARAAVESHEPSEARDRVLEALDECRQVIAFRVPDDADDTVWGPLNAALDAIVAAVGGLSHAEAEGFYDGASLILPTD